MNSIAAMIKALSNRIKGLINISTFEKRNEDGSIRVRTGHGRVLEASESFPYGFVARAEEGQVTVFFRGGNANSIQFLPVVSDEGAPTLNEGDAAVWTKKGGYIICRNAGDEKIEIGGNRYSLVNGEKLKTAVEKNSAILDAIITVLLEASITETGNVTGTVGMTAITGTYSGPSALLIALKAAIGDKDLGDFADILNEEVKHGS